MNHILDQSIRNFLENGRFVLLDVETNVYRDQRYHFDVIQVGALSIESMRNYGKFDRFNEFVRPTFNRTLTGFIKTLTGISQKEVDAADDFPEVWHRFRKWSDGKDILMSWGNYDHNLLTKICSYFNAPYPFDIHFNMKQIFSNTFGRDVTKKSGLKKATRFLGIPYRDDAHNALVDVEMVHEVMAKIVERPESEKLMMANCCNIVPKASSRTIPSRAILP